MDHKLKGGRSIESVDLDDEEFELETCDRTDKFPIPDDANKFIVEDGMYFTPVYS